MNFTTLLAELKNWGYSGTTVAAYCQCAKSTISDIKSGEIASPSFAIGSKIVELHAKAKRASSRTTPRQTQDLRAARKASEALQAKTKASNHLKDKS